MNGHSARLMLEAGGRSWPVQHGDVIGRLGTVGGEALRHFDVLSRQHLRVEQVGGDWHVTLLPNVGNETLCNGVAMIAGQPVPVREACEIQVVTLTLRLFPEAAAPGAEHPSALVTLDESLHVCWHNAAASTLLRGALSQGMDFLQLLETGAALRLRHTLLALREGGELTGAEAALHHDGSTWIALRATRSRGEVLLALREVTHEKQQREAVRLAAARLDAKIGALTTLLTAKPFVDGDLAAALPLLVQDAAELLDDTGVSAWLPEAGAQGFICRALAGATCPTIGSTVTSPKPPAKGEVSPASLATLHSAGLLDASTASAWIEPLDDHGLLVFQRRDAARGWSEPETRLIALTAALGCQLFANAQRRAATEALRSREAALSAELNEAAQYVERRLPAVIAQGAVQVDWVYQPCGRLGGDTLHYEWLDDRRFALCIADVMGHGSRAALHALSLSQALRLLLARGAGDDPASWLAALNKEFPMHANQDLLWTMWCGLYDRGSRTLRHASGGHPPALLCHGTRCEALSTGGPVLGAMAEAEYRSASIAVPDGAKLFLYTDGAYEFPNADGSTGTLEDFTTAVCDAAGMSAGECSYLKTRAAGLCAEEGFPDDFTVVRAQFTR